MPMELSPGTTQKMNELSLQMEPNASKKRTK